MRRFENLGKKKAIIGMIHLLPLPGTPFFEEGNMERSLDKAVADARALYEGGADGCLIQTVDRIYPTGEDGDYARVAAVAAITQAVAASTGPEFQIGVQIMVNALKASLAVVKVCGGSFIRCTALVGATLTPSGMVEANPLDFLNYRTHLDAGDIDLIAEVQSRHFSWMGGDRSVPEVARLALRAGATAVEVSHTDEAANAKLVRDIKQAMPEMPVILGGYTNHDNAARRLAEADGAFVGACLQTEGWGSYVDVERVRAYVDIVSRLT